jgi:hypothetical protein
MVLFLPRIPSVMDCKAVSGTSLHHVFQPLHFLAMLVHSCASICRKNSQWCIVDGYFIKSVSSAGIGLYEGESCILHAQLRT